MNTGAQAKAPWNSRSQGEKLPERRMRTGMVLTSHWQHKRPQDKKACLQHSQGKVLLARLKATAEMRREKNSPLMFPFLGKY